jgi:hypothetical protein
MCRDTNWVHVLKRWLCVITEIPVEECLGRELYIYICVLPCLCEHG